VTKYTVRRMTMKEIADEAGVSESIVFDALKRAGVKSRSRGGHILWTEEKLATIREMYEDGETTTAIAERFEMHRNTVQNALENR
jgi:predicted DNA-binding protein YlxM (UPF0122 family)